MTQLAPPLGKDSAYRPFLPSPLLGEPESVIEEYVFNRMVESGHYSWIARQWAISPSDRPDIVARADHKSGPFWSVVEVKASPLRDKHFRQLERYLARLGELVGRKNVIGLLVAPDVPIYQVTAGRGRAFFAPPEWIAINALLDDGDEPPEEDDVSDHIAEVERARIGDLFINHEAHGFATYSDVVAALWPSD
jgi:hypothetical protein